MQTYEQGQVCYLTGEHGEAVKHVYLGSQWVAMSAEMESVIKILNDRYSARDAEIRRDAFEAGYAQGHNDTVEGYVRDMHDAANDYIAAIIGEEE